MIHLSLIFLFLGHNPTTSSAWLARAAAFLNDSVQYVPAPGPATQPSGASVKGLIRAQGQPLPAEMVVYLEPLGSWTAPATPPGHVRISQKGAQFSPALTVVSVGQPVEFVNDEDRPVEHNVFSNAAAAHFDLGIFPPGQGRSVVFDKPGPAVLSCSIHKFMDGVVYVCPTPLFSRVGADGRYRIEDVPAGKYTLKTWQRRRRFPEQAVTLDLLPEKDIDIDLDLHRK